MKKKLNDDLRTDAQDVTDSFSDTQSATAEDTQYRGDSRISMGLHSHALDTSYGSTKSMSSAYTRRKKEIQTKMW